MKTQGHRPCGSINGAGVASMQARWGEMFGETKEEVEEEVKVKKPRTTAEKKKAATKSKRVIKIPKEATAKEETPAKKSGRKKAVKESE